MNNAIKTALAALVLTLTPTLSLAGGAYATAQYPNTFNWSSGNATSGTYYQISASGGGRARVYGPNNLYVLSSSSASGWGPSGSYYVSAEAPTPGSYAYVSVTW